MTNLGYCCINLTLKEDGISTNRGMVKRTFENEGLSKAGALAEQNIRDLIEIIKWNHKNGYTLFRMSSSLFPWMSEYELKDLPNWGTIKNLLKGIGQLSHKYNQRLTFHPGHFCVIASLNPSVVKKSMKELEQHAEIMDHMGLPRTHYAAINIHINTTQGGKEDAITRFINAFDQLSDAVKSRLVVENDDKESQYSTKDLFRLYEERNIPTTFDYHHHWCHPDNQSQEESIKQAALTWPKGIRQLCHYSSCKKVYEDESSIKRAHADYVYDQIDDYGLDLDIEVEAKSKELATEKYMKQFVV